MKRKTIIKKFLSMLLVLAMTLNLFNITSSANEQSQINSETITKLNEYVETVLPGYLKFNNLLGLDVTLSKPIIIHNWNKDKLSNESYLYFIFSNGTIIGKLTVAKYEGDFISSFDTGGLDEINKTFDLDIPVVFGSYNNNLVMQNESESIVLYGSEEENSLTGLLLHDNISLISEIDTKTYKATPATRNINIQLNVPITYNEYDANIAGGLCWAACVASKVRYHWNNANTISGLNLEPHAGANSVYAKLKELYGGTPIGTALWIQRGYGYFSISVIQTGYMSASSVEYILGQGKPIHIGVDASSGRHGILICGVDYNSTGGYYKIMDPNNRTSYVYAQISQNAVTNGSYFKYISPDGTIYNTWYESVY